MTGRNVVITGANSGIGFAAALHFARSGDNVVMACRNPQRAQRAEQAIRREVPHARLGIMPLDVSDPKSIAAFGRRCGERLGPLDILLNNAGVAALALQRSSAGHEMHLATNYLGAFALSGTLLPLFRADAPGRIVNLGSLVQLFGRLDLDDMDWEKRPYEEWRAYTQSKVAVMVFTVELHRRLQCSGSRILAVAAHPGLANTNISSSRASLSDARPVSKWVHEHIRLLIPTAKTAARSIIFAATDASVRGGEYFGPCALVAGRPARARVNALARDATTAHRLWSLSESMTGVRYLSDV